MGIKSGHRAPYFNKLARSVFRQVNRSELAILASAYYTGRVHSILGQNLNIARHPHLVNFCRACPRSCNFAENRGNFFFEFFFQKSVLGSPDNTLSNF